MLTKIKFMCSKWLVLCLPVSLIHISICNLNGEGAFNFKGVWLGIFFVFVKLQLESTQDSTDCPHFSKTGKMLSASYGLYFSTVTLSSLFCWKLWSSPPATGTWVMLIDQRTMVNSLWGVAVQILTNCEKTLSKMTSAAHIDILNRKAAALEVVL